MAVVAVRAGERDTSPVVGWPLSPPIVSGSPLASRRCRRDWFRRLTCALGVGVDRGRRSTAAPQVIENPAAERQATDQPPGPAQHDTAVVKPTLASAILGFSHHGH